MIPPLEHILPELEHAVAERIESKLLSDMDASQLRDLVYSLVDKHRRAYVDPSGHFADLVDKARDTHTDFMLAKEQSIDVRRRVLDQLLHVLHPAIPSLLSQIPVEERQRPGHHPVRRHHPILNGYELIDGLKQGPTANDTVTYSGTSWWIVGILPEHPHLGTGVRYAKAVHTGKLRSGDGILLTDVELVSASDTAEQIRDTQFRPILERLRDRLLALGGKKIASTTDTLWHVAQRLEAALDALDG